MPGQLKTLKSCRHPNTFEAIPSPVTLRQWEARKLQQPIPIPVLTPRPPPALTDDGTDLTRAFIRGGKREVEHRDDRPPIDRIRARIQMGDAGPRDPGLRPEDFLSAEILAKPDLVETWLEFWTDEVQQQPQ